MKLTLLCLINKVFVHSWYPRKLRPKDNCQRCLGAKGGVLGNENRVNGEVLCDYCHADMDKNKPN